MFNLIRKTLTNEVISRFLPGDNGCDESKKTLECTGLEERLAVLQVIVQVIKLSNVLID